jgi:uncharacterized protein YecA (UPF0149 family)
MDFRKNKKGRELEIPTPEDARTMTDEQLVAKLQSLGIKIDRKSMEKLCENEFSVEDLAEPFEEEFDDANEGKGIERERQGDWIWICFVELWKRWFPDKPCIELLHDCIFEGYTLRKQRNDTDALHRWLEAWKIARAIIDKSGVSIEQFHHRFVMEHSLMEWLQDVSLALRNAVVDEPECLPMEVDFYREVLKRTKSNHLDEFVQNMRMNLGESLFEYDKTDEADQLYEEWLKNDPQWGWGWISWGYCYLGGVLPANPEKVERILREGLAVENLRNRLAVMEKLAEFLDAQGRPEEAEAVWQDCEREAAAVAVSASNSETVSKSRKNTFDTPTMTMLKEALVRTEAETDNSISAPSDTPGRKEPCPCGSGKKYKRCCGT